MASFSSSASRSLSQALPSTWSSDMDRPPSPGAPSCATTRRTSRPWIYSLLRPLALICSMALSLFDWPAGGLVWVAVTTNPTAEWLARQISEAFPWNEAPRYLIRDRDRVYGTMVTRRVRAMGIRDKPIACGSPWQNCFAERLIGSIRRECLDHFVILGEAHLRRILAAYAAYYNVSRTHRSLDKDTPFSRPVQRAGSIHSHAVLGGLHHHYVRV